MLKTKNILKRIEKLEEQIKAKEPITMIWAFENADNTRCKISSSIFGVNSGKEWQEYDSVEDFIQKYNINTNSKNTYVFKLKVAPNRTYEDVMNS